MCVLKKKVYILNNDFFYMLRIKNIKILIIVFNLLHKCNIFLEGLNIWSDQIIKNSNADIEFGNF